MDYSAQIALAHKLIAQFGGPGQLVITGSTSAVPADDWIATDEVDAPVDCVVAVIDAGTKTHAATAYIPAQGLAVAPSQGMLIRDAGGALWALPAPPACLNPAGTQPILYVCEVARWPTS